MLGLLYTKVVLCLSSDSSKRNNHKKLSRLNHDETKINRELINLQGKYYITCAQIRMKCIFFTLHSSWRRLQQNRAFPTSCLVSPRL